MADELDAKGMIGIGERVVRYWPTPWLAKRPSDDPNDHTSVQIQDAHERTIMRLEWPFHSDYDADEAEQATYLLADALAAAPDLARACIANAERIAELEAENERLWRYVRAETAAASARDAFEDADGSLRDIEIADEEVAAARAALSEQPIEKGAGE